MTMLKEKVKKQWVIPKIKGSGTPPLEADILTECKKWLKTQDLFFCRLEGGGKLMNVNGKQFMARSDSSGLPDLMIVKDGKTYFVELKRQGGHITDEQAKLLNDAAYHGVVCSVCCSLEGLKKALDSEWTMTTVTTYAIPVFY
jgi:hypothetical protein